VPVDDRTDGSVLESLVARAQHGETRAFDELARRCHGRIYRWALVATGDPDDADDVAQEVLVQLERHLGRFEGRSRFTTWLYQVTRNAATSLHRRRGAAQRASQALSPDAPSLGQSTHWIEDMETAELVSLVKALFQELPLRQREVFDLAELQGIPASEVAEMLEMNPATVRAHLLRARRTIRTRILATHPALVEDRQR